MTFDVKLLSAAIGAEITGVDLAVPVSTDVQDEIYQVLIDRSVIFFPGQDITPAAHRAFAATFGTLGRRHPLYAHVPGFDEITLLSYGAGNPPDTDGWHTDLTFQQNPPFASVLVARDLPPVGGDTLWSSLCAAYDALPDDVKAHVADKVAVHDMGEFRNELTKMSQTESRSQKRCNDSAAPSIRWWPRTLSQGGQFSTSTRASRSTSWA